MGMDLVSLTNGTSQFQVVKRGHYQHRGGGGIGNADVTSPVADLGGGSWGSMEPPFWLVLVLRGIDFVLQWNPSPNLSTKRLLLWLTLASFTIVNRSIDPHSYSFLARNVPGMGVA